MLLQLTIENFALIEKLTISFEKEFNILSGETGAGKSILIDAINYVLGSKFNKDLIRTGEMKTFVEAVFDIENEKIKECLDDLNIEYDDLVIISRETFQNGKSIVKVNGKAIILSTLKKLTEKLIDIHGQHQNQALLDKANHIIYLDSYGEDKIHEKISEYYVLFKKLKDLDEKIQNLKGNEDREKLLNYLKFQVDDIDEANLKVGEDEELAEKYNLLSHAEKINNSLTIAYNLLNERSDGESILDNLSHVCHELTSIEKHLEKVREINQCLNNIYYNLQDISRDVRNLNEDVVYDEKELEQVNSRIYKISLYKKKYGEKIEDILNYKNELLKQYDELLNSEATIKMLIAEKDMLLDRMEVLSKEIHLIRLDIANELENRISDELKYVGLEKCAFKIEVVYHSDFNLRGKDEVQYLVSTNPGEPLKSMEKVVSGGELSRIMLALKTVFVNKDRIPTVIFDEIDTGISGRIAQCVAEKMYEISTKHQVFCITHLPQIACMSDCHFLVSKHIHNNKTFTQVKKITEEDKILEIAKMIGGVEVTSSTIENATEMTKMANQKKKNIRKC
ncbi:DNA repair protein RecN [Clostridium polyendosporum]|uniref:DNA repair protein RecN n=1 Tax=Clostridium polyendosporum TaxID=69208 RepID=A0A919RX78_9CLOT|nr:DNA repair protein RecN [Clostridium polyendosporum]GIM27937.1 DNA repair protein RecN [Clostridium polyendosporum]